ncbi:hypothetical protein MTY66_61650 (plasmid) [Mycolicibacterium sp. TY66]|uniref:hypothetical protein n=1 Tax=unclassified Mycolicibacterium TaxID=2636767 RepID=UPI001BB32951|nr:MULTISPECIES: hypothetical protein [unclassified Mycolicibacterium]BCI84540.1 hypothetical protein MTY66_61650 [Mycolicibacterium sp. TY66]BCJ84770.1 hypothetical protein MTY81_61430 [Mycolicibacterium sp. TY81]
MTTNDDHDDEGQQDGQQGKPPTRHGLGMNTPTTQDFAIGQAAERTGLADLARRTMATAVITVSTMATAACLSEPLQETEELPKHQATQQINATFLRARVPASFTPLAVTATTATWGAQARTVTAAFTATRATVDEFMSTVATQGDPTWMKQTSSSCPPANDTHSAPVAYQPPHPILDDWYDRGVFQRCKPIEAWSIAATEFRDAARSAGHIFTQPAGSLADPSELTVLIGTTTA